MVFNNKNILHFGKENLMKNGIYKKMKKKRIQNENVCDFYENNAIIIKKKKSLLYLRWTDRVDLGLLQRQPVALPHVRVALQHKHGDRSLSCHDDHVGIGHRAVHYGRAQVHGDKVELRH